MQAWMTTPDLARRYEQRGPATEDLDAPTAHQELPADKRPAGQGRRTWCGLAMTGTWVFAPNPMRHCYACAASYVWPAKK